MSDNSLMNRKAVPDYGEPKGRTVGETEHSWCKAVSGGTGVTVLTISGTSKQIRDTQNLQNALHKLQNSHPILKSRIHYNTATNTFSFISTPTVSNLEIKLHSQDDLLNTVSTHKHTSLSPIHTILEHEMNTNAWTNLGRPQCTTMDVFYASMYEVSNEEWVVALRLHSAACDRTTAEALLRELKEELTMGGVGMENSKRDEVNLGIESLIPKGKTKKTMWAHGMDMLSYSVNSLRLTNLKFKNVKGERCSQVVRLQMSPHHTHSLLYGCESRGIKLCGALAAAGLIAAYSSIYGSSDRQKTNKYGVVTLTDCRSILDPPLSFHNFGFYHSAIINGHAMKGGEKLWDMAKKCYTAFANSKKQNKHFSDMSDLNFLMCKAIDNPSLTASSSLRTSVISVFEDPIIDKSYNKEQQKGLVLDDYMGCASAHGVGPSIAVFDTIRDGGLDCVCVYPSPLHSREQMKEFVDDMKRILVKGAKCMEN